MHNRKKGQSAIEVAALISFLTFFLIVALAAIADDLIRASDESYRGLLLDVADVIEQEAAIALGSEDGYFHSFTLPLTLNGQPYITSITNASTIISVTNTNITIVTVASKRSSAPLNVTKALSRNVEGNLVRGQNSVQNERSLVVFRPIPLTPAQQFQCGGCFGGQCGACSLVSVEECCDHSYASCCT